MIIFNIIYDYFYISLIFNFLSLIDINNTSFESKVARILEAKALLLFLKAFSYSFSNLSMETNDYYGNMLYYHKFFF